ncbi:MAG TPA: glycoside hydrolase family 43 protein [Marmoricola sp.]
MPVHHSRAWFALALLVALMVPGVAVAETTRPAPIGQDPFRPGHTYRGDFPDPTVIYTQGKYYAYSTTTAHLNLPVLVSSDARTWTATGPTKRLRAGLGPDALPKLPTWAWHDAHGLGTVWAPSVAHWDGRYVVAYAVRKWGHAHKMCISTAVSSSPRGPFVDHTTKPLVCPYNRGAIDPMLYHENGHNYLLYKTEDISIGRPTRIWIRRVTHSGRATTADPPHRLLTANQPWEERTVEGPGMITYAGKRYLFYSAGGWGNKKYAIGYALCASVTGPCKRVQQPATNPGGTPTYPPFLKSGNGLVAPGGATPFLDRHGRLRLAYHAWDKGAAHYPKSIKCRTSVHGCGQRRLHVARLGLGADGALAIRVLG